MRPEPDPDFIAILRALVRARVDFFVVGGVAAVLHGVPLRTLDLDVVHSRKPENVRRLLRVLERLDAYYRGQPGRRLKPDETHLSSAGHQLLMTRFGPLDLLGTVGRGRGYEDLLKHTSPMRIGRRLEVLVLSLNQVIAIKEETAGEKDRAVLPLLRRTLAEAVSLSRKPKFLALIESSRARHKAEGGISSQALRRKLARRAKRRP